MNGTLYYTIVNAQEYVNRITKEGWDAFGVPAEQYAKFGELKEAHFSKYPNGYAVVELEEDNTLHGDEPMSIYPTLLDAKNSMVKVNLLLAELAVLTNCDFSNEYEYRPHPRPIGTLEPEEPSRLYPRQCTHCKSGMSEGYCVAEGDAYYCSEDCFTAADKECWDQWQSDLSRDLGDDFTDWCYWTDWEIDELDSPVYDSDGTEYSLTGYVSEVE